VRTWTARLVFVAVAALGVRISAQEAAPAREATLQVRVISLGTEEPLEGAWVWAGRKSFDGAEHDFDELGAEPGAVEGASRRMDASGAPERTPVSGELELRVPSGTALYLAGVGLQDGDLVRLDPLAPGETRAQTLAVWTGSARYQGLVLARADGAPVAGARIQLGPFDETSDAKGRFRIDSNEFGPEVRVTAPGFAPALGTLQLGHALATRPQVFRLERTATLRGRVLELDGRPVAGTPVGATIDQVHLLQPVPLPEGFWSRRPDGLESWTTTTDTEGRFELAGLAPRVWLELALPDQRPPWTQLYSLAPGETRALELVPDARVTLGGTALDPEGKPAAGVQVRARYFGLELFESQDSFQTVAPDGSFRFTGMRPGTWFLCPASNPEELGFARLERRVEIPTDPRAQELALRLERGSFLQGRVLDAAGEPAEAARIEVRSSAGELVREESTLEDGRFSIGPLRAGAYRLRASRYGFFPDAAVEAPAGARELELRLPPPAGSIAVGARGNTHTLSPNTILFPRGRPELAREESFGLHVHASTFEALEDGVYDAVLTTEDGRLGRVEGLRPSPAETYAAVTLAPCASVRVVFTGPELFALVLARQGDVPYARGFATQGTPCVLFVPPDKVRLELFPSDVWGGLPSGPPLVRELTVALGEEPDVLVP